MSSADPSSKPKSTKSGIGRALVLRSVSAADVFVNDLVVGVVSNLVVGLVVTSNVASSAIVE